jgi:hypothetical protein
MEGKDQIEKKPYEKPQVVHRQPLEGIAGACDATDPVNGKAGAPCSFLQS